MSESVTLELPAGLVRQARALAAASGRRLDDAVAEWIGRAVAETPVEGLPDDQLLAVCDGQLPAADQDELSGLLADDREGRLSAEGRRRLDDLMAEYRRGLVVKARAVKEAVARGLKPRVAGDGA